MEWLLKLLYWPNMMIDCYLTFLIGFKLTDPRFSWTDRRVLVPAVLLGTFIYVDRMLEVDRMVFGLIHLGLYLVLFFLFCQARWQAKVSAYLIMIVTLISSEVLFGGLFVNGFGIDADRLLTDYSVIHLYHLTTYGYMLGIIGLLMRRKIKTVL